MIFDQHRRPIRRALGFRDALVIDGEVELTGIGAAGKVPLPADMDAGWGQSDAPVGI